jgi:hypothetical protein
MRRARVGTVLVLLGGAAWVPYFLLKPVVEPDPPLLPFLALHLSGVIPGALLGSHGVATWLWRRFARRRAFGG